MKYRLFILFVFGIICVCSCGYRKDRYTCVYSTIVDCRPKFPIKQDFTRRITFVLKFRNDGKDSIYFPFYRLGRVDMKSHFYIKYKEYKTICSASFCGRQDKINVMAPGDYGRIFILLYYNQLDELHIPRDVDVRNLKDMVEIHYEYNALDKSQCKLYTPKMEIKKSKEIEVVYDYVDGQYIDF